MKKKFLSLLMVLAITMFVFVPFIRAYADESSALQIILMEVGGSYTVTATGVENTSHTGSANFMVAAGETVTLTATAESTHNFVGWYNCEEYDLNGQGVMAWRTVGDALTTEAVYSFETTNSYYNLMPLFESKFGHNNIWTTAGGTVAVLYEAGGLDGNHFGTGEVVDYTKGDTITIKARANEGYHFVGWFLTDPAVSVPENYVREPVISTQEYYTYQPGVTTVAGVDEPLNYLTAVFEEGALVDSHDVITRIDVSVELPCVGDEITLTEKNGEKRQSPQAEVILPEDAHYILGGNEEHNYMYYYLMTEAHEFFEGVFEEKNYLLNIYLLAEEGYTFASDVEISVNGEEGRIIEINNGDQIEFEYTFTPEPAKKQYEVESKDGSAVALFKFSDGFNFVLSFDDILAHTPEEIESMYGVPADYITQAIEFAKKNTKDFGNLIGLYAITVDDPGLGYSDALTLKIKMTDEMKKYNHFQFLFLDEANEFKLEEAFDVTIDGDWLIVELPHLSAYALTGEYIPPAETNSNPLTGDRIVFYITMLGLCTMGLVEAGFYTKKKYFHKTIKQD